MGKQRLKEKTSKEEWREKESRLQSYVDSVSDFYNMKPPDVQLLDDYKFDSFVHDLNLGEDLQKRVIGEGGFYFPQARRIVLREGFGSERMRPIKVLTHELGHYLGQVNDAFIIEEEFNIRRDQFLDMDGEQRANAIAKEIRMSPVGFDRWDEVIEV